MSRFKDFGAGAPVNTTPIVFRLHGEEFRCVPTVQGAVLMNMVSKADMENPSAAAAVVMDFFKQVLVDESWARFDALAHDKERIVSMETLGEIIGWLTEEYSGERPEKQPEV